MESEELIGKLLWCSRQKKGIKLVGPNENLCDAYIKKTRDSLRSMKLNADANIREWAVDAAYYSRYQAIYALLQKCGIECEIQDCSIMLLRFLFSDKLNEKMLKEMEKAKEQRINLVYYTNRILHEEDFRRNIESAPAFVLAMEKIISETTSGEIAEARKKLMKILV